MHIGHAQFLAIPALGVQAVSLRVDITEIHLGETK